jgi:glutamine amidotransferase-like uncharacterized protein
VEGQMKKLNLALFVNHPECSYQCAEGIIKSLEQKYNIICIDQNQIKPSFFKKYSAIIFPGGIGDSDSWHRLLEPTKEVITEQIHNGKFYLGICMGAYWAGSHYYNLLDNVDVVQYIKRPNSDIKRSYSTVAKINWNNNTEHMFFYDGCSLIGNQKKFNVIARYSNKDPAAIIQKNIGLIGPHPESDRYWYNKPYLKPYWHSYKHHQLLSKFVDKLLDK